LLSHRNLIQALISFKNDIKRSEESYLYNHNEEISNQIANLEHQSLPYQSLFTDQTLIQSVLFYMEKLGLEDDKELTLKFFGPIVISSLANENGGGNSAGSSHSNSTFQYNNNNENTHRLLKNRRIPVAPSLDPLSLKKSLAKSTRNISCHSHSDLEIPILLPVMDRLSSLVNWIFQIALDIFGIEWTRLREFNLDLRFMANKRNLVYILVTYLTFKLIKMIF